MVVCLVNIGSLYSQRNFEKKKLFDEIKGRIKLDDESLPYTDKKYVYWTKTIKEENYAIKLRKRKGTNKIETRRIEKQSAFAGKSVFHQLRSDGPSTPVELTVGQWIFAFFTIFEKNIGSFLF